MHASSDPLHGKTLKLILTELQGHYDWDGLAKLVDIRCFSHDPSLKSSLTFLRKTPWARTKVEELYIDLQAKQKADDPWADSPRA
ncbi:DUF2132 domain-containing protein [Alginatibacterium sediminis]|uniref:DUF2132 domain-containing protein n=1 Tax=Alginatibacterium sediminis TaxID=2164068 RepID=A0A420E5M7_9ALTE|nr:VF530 family protein [Alginatibacterium sediminis]RKF12772.1 DUF2132 domain-containing protein [Alginatibacterium sediminis]